MLLNQPSRVILLCSLVLIASVSGAQQNSQPDANNDAAKIPFYLPINQNQFPELIQKLESALSEASIETPNLSRLAVTTTDYWHPYQQGIRLGRPGLYFAAPHFSSWLVNHHKFEPMLRLSGKLQYVIVSRRSDSHIFEVGDLTNRTVCTSAVMDISFLLVRESMERSILSAETLRVQNVAKEMSDNNKRCDAFSLSEHLFLSFATDDPFQFIRLQQSKTFSNYAYLLHPSIASENKKALKKFLTSQQVNEILAPMYRLFAKEPSLLGGKPSNYPQSHSSSLEPYWGSKPPITQ